MRRMCERWRSLRRVSRSARCSFDTACNEEYVEYQQKFFKLKRSLEEFKNICGVAFESRLRELHSTDTAALLERVSWRSNGMPFD